jgi:hypothetical protein
MDIHLKITGVLLIALGLFHVFFYKYFNWKQECSSLSMINRQMFYVHTFFISLTLFLMGLLCLLSTANLVNTDFGRQISLGLGIFWMIRLVFQFFVYSSKLWKGKSFETTMHVLFSIIWVYFSAVFILIYIGKE